MNKPKVSVLMPVFNGEKFLREAIDSILKQTYMDFEFLIINDGSTDRSEEIIKSYTDPRIRYIKNETNFGIITTLNKGIMEAAGKYIARMDCDDISLPERLKYQIDFLENNSDTVLISGNIQLINEEGDKIGYWDEDIQTTNNDEIRKTLPWSNCIAHPSIVIRKEIIKKYLYSLNQRNSEDWDLWMRLASDGKKLEKINYVLVKYRIHNESLTYKSNQKNVLKKISNVQANFFLRKISKLSINRFDLNVLIYLIKNLDQLFLKGKLQKYKKSIGKFFVVKIYEKIKSILLYYQLLTVLTFKKNNSNIFFFFPFYHVGGAERVHIDILKSISIQKQKPWVFFTSVSNNKAFYEEFKMYGKPFPLSSFGLKRTNNLKKAIAKAINRHPDGMIFGCNSSYYYDLIPYLKEDIICMDLIHAFSDKTTSAAEDWSLPFVNRLSKRIFISKKTIKDVKQQYLENNVPQKYQENILYIPNYVNIPSGLFKKEFENTPIEILYVGRGTSEKRIHLVGEIAKKCFELKLNVKFTMVGNLKSSLDREYHNYVNLAGEITQFKFLENIYKQSHIILITSSREGFPMTIMEGMAYKLVPISTNVGDIPVHLQHGNNGFIIENKTEEKSIIDDFVNYIHKLDNDRGILKNMSEKAYNYAKENFNHEQFYKAYRKILLKKV